MLSGQQETWHWEDLHEGTLSVKGSPASGRPHLLNLQRRRYQQGPSIREKPTQLQRE